MIAGKDDRPGGGDILQTLHPRAKNQLEGGPKEESLQKPIEHLALLTRDVEH
jgi:hypothetical protein